MMMWGSVDIDSQMMLGMVFGLVDLFFVSVGMPATTGRPPPNFSGTLKLVSICAARACSSLLRGLVGHE